MDFFYKVIKGKVKFKIDYKVQAQNSSSKQLEFKN